MKKISSCVALFLSVVTAPAQAAVFSGALTGGGAFTNGGVFELLTPGQGFIVGEDNQQSNNLFAYDERQGVMLLADLSVDIGTTILAGTRFDSHYVFFDPRLQISSRGSVTFSGNVLGILSTAASETATDGTLGRPGVAYQSPLLRGLENTDFVTFTGNRVNVNWLAASPGDYIRVLTLSAVPSVPEPATWAMMIIGFGTVGFALRRRRVLAPSFV